MDATSTDDESLSSLAAKLLSQGMVFLCPWGPDSGRVHDVFDLVEVRRGGSSEDDFVVTNLYREESDLDEAVWDAVVTAIPSDAYIETCRAVVAIVVGHPEWSERVETAFADFGAFNEMVLARDASEGVN